MDQVVEALVEGTAGFRRAAMALLEELEDRVGGGPWSIATVDGALAVARPTAVVDLRAAEALEDTGIAIPLVTVDGQVVGHLRAGGAVRNPETFAGDYPSISRFADVLAALVSAEQRANDAVRRAAEAEAASLTDGLTGLLNRRGWDQALGREEARCARNPTRSGVIVAVVDLDNLKTVNDTQGHLAGDVLLAHTAAVLRETCRGSDVVARVGGDEFAVLAVDSGEPATAGLERRVREALAAEGISASVGAAARSPEHDLRVTWLLADAQMYAVKRRRS